MDQSVNDKIQQLSRDNRELKSHNDELLRTIAVMRESARCDALTLAVQSHGGNGVRGYNSDTILEVAKKYEEYLNGST